MKAIGVSFFVLFFCFAAPALATEVGVEVANPLAVERGPEVVAVSWSQLIAKLGELTPDNARVLAAGGEVVLSQPIDNDGDGTIDELLFLVRLPASGKSDFKVVADASLKAPETEIRTHARYVPERKDDFAWENDLVAFRAYGPALEKGDENSGFDCFMKRVKYPILDKWYKAEQMGKSYHVDYGEGYDGYKVGASLGCGGSAAWQDGKLILSEVYRDWKQFSNGPLRSSFRLSYGPWDVGGRTVTETKLISIDLGQRLFKVDETFMLDGTPGRLDVAVGLATHEGAAQAHENKTKGSLYAWEKIDDAHLGTAVVLAPDLIKDYQLIDSKEKYQGNAFFVVDPGDDGKFSYHAGFGWEKAKEITTPEQWRSYLADFIDRAGHPLAVKIK